jgi:uncharacterized Zn finger protein
MTESQGDQRQWWVDRWLELLDSYRFKKRLERARNYAREGNVLSLQFMETKLAALVQGTDVDPYRVTLGLDPFSDEDWHYVVATLAEKAIYAAQLLSGAMPPSIDQVFVQNGLNLFPFTLGEVQSQCSCPDQVNPCKHIGAVYYQLADQFQEDPFVIFRLRGRSRRQLLEQLSHYRRLTPEQLQTYDPTSFSSSVVDISESAPAPEAENIDDKTQKQTKAEQQAAIQSFWECQGDFSTNLVVMPPPEQGLQILERLGDIPLNYETAKEIRQALAQVYTAVAPAAIAQVMGTEE